jgi:hypothetical protein
LGKNIRPQKARQLIEDIAARLDIYDIPGAYAAVPGFVDA